MKPNELRIGNYVTYISNLPEKIELISINEVDTDNHDALPLQQIEPIPLTKQWLNKLGFVKEFNYSVSDLKILPKGFFGYGDGVVYWNTAIIMNKLPKYVHQLQNLYFTLAGKELKIKQQ